MSKVILTIGDTPADCSVVIDGVKREDVIAVTASVDTEDGPFVELTTINQAIGSVEMEQVDFKPVTENVDG